MRKKRAMITAVGHYVPEKILTNLELEKMISTNDEWIRTRTGIRERRILEKGATSDLGVGAVKNLMERRGMTASEIEVIIVATVTPDMFFPATACVIQDKLGAKNAFGFDLNAACSGFVYALTIGSQLIETGAYKKVVVVGADTMSSIMDYTCLLYTSDD